MASVDILRLIFVILLVTYSSMILVLASSYVLELKTKGYSFRRLHVIWVSTVTVLFVLGYLLGTLENWGEPFQLRTLFAWAGAIGGIINLGMLGYYIRTGRSID